MLDWYSCVIVDIHLQCLVCLYSQCQILVCTLTCQVPGVDALELGKQFEAAAAHAVTRPHVMAPDK